jgi:hypothetical protein
MVQSFTQLSIISFTTTQTELIFEDLIRTPSGITLLSTTLHQVFLLKISFYRKPDQVDFLIEISWRKTKLEGANMEFI